MQLTPELLLRAYALGVFPMAESRQAEELHWVDPELRGVLPLDGIHLPRKLYRKLKRNDFLITCNQAFAEVVRACAEPVEKRPETWINPTIERLYGELHRMGFAQSIEVWLPQEGDRRLVGGLYGVSLGAAFFGESMFTRVTDASKVALFHLIIRLRRGGFLLLDTQFTTPHLRRFGAVDVPRDHYKGLLGRALREKATFPVEITPEEFQDELEALRQESRETDSSPNS